MADPEDTPEETKEEPVAGEEAAKAQDDAAGTAGTETAKAKAAEAAEAGASAEAEEPAADAGGDETGFDLQDLEGVREVPDGSIFAEPSDDGEEMGIERTAAELEAVYDVPVNVSAVLGKAHMPVSKLLKLGKGAVVELDRKVGEAVDVYVNNRLVARGEVVVVEDHLGITMTEIIKGEAKK